MKVYVTKYALTKGIFAAEASDCFDISPTMVKLTSREWSASPYFHANEWYTTPKAAIDRSEKMRAAKIAALKKQIAKLEQMTFEIEEVKP